METHIMEVDARTMLNIEWKLARVFKYNSLAETCAS